MSDDKPDLDLAEPETKSSEYPWAWIAGLAVLFVLAGAFILKSKTGDSRPAQRAALEQELKQIKAAMDDSRDHVFDITERLNALKQSIALHQVKDRENAVAEYNKLAAEQRDTREKVKQLADEFNQKLEKLNELQ